MSKYNIKKHIFFLLLSSVSLNAIPQSFTEQTGISLTGVYRSSVAWGDYDNDGNLDILLTGYSSSEPISKIYHNNGDNSFTWQTGIILTDVFGAVAWGDYDNDGDLDILLTGSTANYSTVSKIYRNDGNNKFTEQTGITLTGVGGSSVAWGDFDNDGDLDILITGDTGTEQISKIYRNNGDNSFTWQPGSKLIPVNSGSVALGDFDNDNDLDILLTGMNSNSREVSKIYRNDGDFIFKEQTSVSFPGVYASSVAWGDYDNDGNLDILLTGDTGSGRITKIYRNNGNRTFTEQTEISLPVVYISSVNWTDYDNDGDLDIQLSGVSGYNNISSIYQNIDNNNFIEQPGISLAGVASCSVAWGDYDNDGNLDILLTGATDFQGVISKIYRNDIQVHNISPSVPKGLQSLWINNSLMFRWNRSSDNTTPSKAIKYNLRIGTFPGGNNVKSGQALQNGELLLPKIHNLINDTSIILNLPLNNYFWSVEAVDNSGMASGFAQEKSTPVDTIQANGLNASIRPDNSLLVRWQNGNGSRRALFARLSSNEELAKPENGKNYHAESFFGQGDQISTSGWFCVSNGKADSAIIYGLDEGLSYDVQVIEYSINNNIPEYFRKTGDANPGVFSLSIFSEQTNIELPEVRNGFASWGDYDNDGDLDILMSGRIYKNNGDNNFTEQTGLTLPVLEMSSGGWGDYDNDGDLDILLIGYSSSGHVSLVFRNDGNNTFTEQTGINLMGIAQGSAAWGDYNNDGKLDILITGEFTSIIYRNNGDNTFSEQTSISLTGVELSTCTWGDYDNDGDLDILLTGYSEPYKPVSKIFSNNGNNNFTELKSAELKDVSGGSTAWGDYDNDGDLDIIVTGLSGPESPISNIYRNTGNNSFIEQKGIVLTPVSAGSVAWGDYDNDGDLDILLTGCPNTGYISKIYRNNGDNTFTEQAVLLAGDWSGSALWGDYDNDGDLDILRGSKIFRNNIFMKAGKYSFNSKPVAPLNTSSISQPGIVKLIWSPSEYDETNSRTMTYNIRIGTSSGSSDILSAQSNNITGYRHIPSMGNAQLDTSFLFKISSPGKYYWSVQAVDQGYQGGPWSAVDSFVVSTSLAFFKYDTVCLGLPTTFTDQSVSSNNITSWKWDFGDGGNSTNPDPEHYFALPEEYNVTLEITADGKVYSATNRVMVKPAPIAGFTYNKISQNGEVVSFANTTNTEDLGISGWSWNFGDNDTYADKNPPNHGYLNQGSYTVTLIVNAVNGCTDAFSEKIEICYEPFSKPEIYAHGPNVWYLACSIDTANYYRWYLNDNLIPGADKFIYVADQTLGTYKVEISNSGACYTSSDEITIPTEIAGKDDADPFAGLKIYPNPTPGFFTIEMDNQVTGELKIKIFTQEGKQVLDIDTEKISEHFSNLINLKRKGKGIYLINMQSDKHSVIRKVIVE